MTAQQTGVLGSVQVMTQGIPNADFTDAGGGTCSIGQAYLAGQSCTVKVAFQPRYPGEHHGAVSLLQNNGSVLAIKPLEGVGNGPLGIIVPGLISTVAGNGAWIYRQDGVLAASTPIFLPMGEATDAAGNLYLSDSSNNRIRRVDAVTGLISTVAGNGAPGFSGDNGPATSAMLSNPSAIVLDGAGNIYFADSANHVIRMVNALTGIITTVAGAGNQQGYAGDLGLATAAKLNEPYGLAFDDSGDLYIADTGNNVIRKITISSGIITTVAGTGTAGFAGDGHPAITAQLSSPWGIAFAGDGSLYIADLGNNVVRRINPSGVISTVVGTGSRGFSGDSGPATAATLSGPASVAVDLAGNIYVADSGNNRVRKVNAVTGDIETIAGVGNEAFSGDGGTSAAAGLYGPYSLFLDGPGNLYIGDMFHNRIRMISSNAVALQYPTIRVNRTSSPQKEIFENDGNADLSLTALIVGSNTALDAATSTCAAGQTLSVSTSCALGVEFAPTVVGSGITGSIHLTSNATNNPGVINLMGNVLTVDPTTVTLTSSANPSALGAPVILTALVTTAGTSETGTVQFLDGTTPIGTATLNASGTAVLTTSALALGQHILTAAYAGDTSNAASTSLALTQVVKQGTSLTLQSGLNPSIASANVTFTATLSGATGTPRGTVAFSENSVSLGSSPVSSTGVAILSIATLVPGSHSIIATYSGDSSNLGSQSSPLSQTVAQATTITTIGSSNTTISVGTSVTFTASVSSSGGAVPTGTVIFKDGSVTLGSGTLDSAGVATLSNNTLSPGQHPITIIYQGDTNNAASTSVALTEVVQQIITSTVLTSDANPANAGATLHLTATVSATGGTSAAGALTGLVTFEDGAVTLGTGTLSASGVATLTFASLSVGQHSITAVYAGNTNYATSTSTALQETIQQATTTTSLTSNASPSIAGKMVTLLATVSSVGGTAMGTVTFHDGATTLGQGLLDAKGNATLVTSSLGVGQHTVVATYNGDANDFTSSSSPLTQTVQIATSSLNLTSTANPATAGVALTLTASLTSDGAQPSGSMVFKDGSTILGTVGISGATPVTLTTSTLSVGSHVLTAFYAGDANNAPSTSSAVVEVVQPAITTTTLVSSQNPAPLNQGLIFTANVSSAGLVPGGSVIFQDGTTVLSTVALNASGIASLSTSTLSLGNHSVIAIYSGDTNHSASRSTTLNQQILQATAISINSSFNPSIAGKSVTFTAKLPGVAGLTPTGTVTFKDGGVVLGVSAVDGTGTAIYSTTELVLGSHSITASYGGDTNYQAIGSASLAQTIQIADTSITLTSNTNPALFRTPVTFTATLAGTGGPLTGTVTFHDGTTVLGAGVVDGSGVATYTTTSLAPGLYSISALYSGDSKNLPNSSGAIQQQVRQTTTTILASNLNPSFTLDPVVLTAAVTNGGSDSATGTITFTEGAAVLGSSQLDAAGMATLSMASLGAGQHSIGATYGGDVGNTPGTSSILVQKVQLRPTTDVLTATASSLSGGQQLTLISVVRWTGPVAPTGTVAFKNGNTIVGTSVLDPTGVATLTVVLDRNAVSLVASYSGDSVYAGSDSPATLTATSAIGTAVQFTMQLSQSAIQLQSKQHKTVNLTLTSTQGFSDTLSLGCLGLPYAATCTFSTDRENLAANGTQTLQIVIDTGSPLTAGSQATARNSVPTSTAVLCFMPLGALFGLMLFRSRSRSPLGGLLLLLCFIGLTIGLSGCGSLTINGTPPGSYTFKVTAVGVKTGATQSQDLTLTVTQ